MGTLETNAVLVTNSITFFSNVGLAILLIYFGKSTDFKGKIRLPWITLSTGIMVSATSYLIQILGVLDIAPTGTTLLSTHLVMLIGTAITFFSFSSIYLTKINDINSLRKRYTQIKKIMKRLKRKYRRREIPEDDLRKIYTDLTKELVEIEVKLKEMEKK